MSSEHSGGPALQRLVLDAWNQLSPEEQATWTAERLLDEVENIFEKSSVDRARELFRDQLASVLVQALAPNELRDTGVEVLLRRAELIAAAAPQDTDASSLLDRLAEAHPRFIRNIDKLRALPGIRSGQDVIQYLRHWKNTILGRVLAKHPARAESPRSLDTLTEDRPARVPEKAQPPPAAPAQPPSDSPATGTSWKQQIHQWWKRITGRGHS